jgi:hypothetical protein
MCTKLARWRGGKWLKRRRQLGSVKTFALPSLRSAKTPGMVWSLVSGFFYLTVTGVSAPCTCLWPGPGISLVFHLTTYCSNVNGVFSTEQDSAFNLLALVKKVRDCWEREPGIV